MTTPTTTTHTRLLRPVAGILLAAVVLFALFLSAAGFAQITGRIDLSGQETGALIFMALASAFIANRMARLLR